jgi:hypothetical protein
LIVFGFVGFFNSDRIVGLVGVVGSMGLTGLMGSMRLMGLMGSMRLMGLMGSMRLMGSFRMDRFDVALVGDDGVSQSRADVGLVL